MSYGVLASSRPGVLDFNAYACLPKSSKASQISPNRSLPKSRISARRSAWIFRTKVWQHRCHGAQGIHYEYLRTSRAIFRGSQQKLPSGFSRPRNGMLNSKSTGGTRTSHVGLYEHLSKDATGRRASPHRTVHRNAESTVAKRAATHDTNRRRQLRAVTNRSREHMVHEKSSQSLDSFRK